MLTEEGLNRSQFKKIRDYFPSLDWIMYMDGVYLAGGALRTLIDPSDTVSDIDLFFESEKAVEPVRADLLADGYKIVFQCEEGYITSFKKILNPDELCANDIKSIKVQLITRRYYESAEDLVSSFDITPCCVAWDGTTLTYIDDWKKNVGMKIAYINNVTYPVATINRMAKYRSKGYWFPESAIQYLVKCISEGDFKGDELALYID